MFATGGRFMLQRFSVSLEDKLLAQFDSYIADHQYQNRSEAVRDLIRKVLVHEEWKADKEVVGVISLVYDHHQRQLQDKLTEIQHEYHHDVVSTTHIHLTHDDCLEVIIVRGKASRVRSLADQLIALRGIKDGALNMSSTGAHLH
jgi:CopG family nickel-responsive transcriptional regulator